MGEILAAAGLKPRGSRQGSSGLMAKQLKTAPPPRSLHQAPLQLAGAGAPPAAFPALPSAAPNALLHWRKRPVAAAAPSMPGAWFAPIPQPAPGFFGAPLGMASPPGSFAQSQPAPLPLFEPAGEAGGAAEGTAAEGGAASPLQKPLEQAAGGLQQLEVAGKLEATELEAAGAEPEYQAGHPCSQAFTAVDSPTAHALASSQQPQQEELELLQLQQQQKQQAPQYDVGASWPPCEGAMLSPLYQVGGAVYGQGSGGSSGKAVASGAKGYCIACIACTVLK
jgi:hypothetical protein